MKKTTLATAFAAVVVTTSAQAGPLPYPVSDADFFDHGPNVDAKVELGKNLFWDKILSGNLNISCATCHHALAGTGDGLALPIGEGGVGLGIARGDGSGGPEAEGGTEIEERVPRNAPFVYNLGATYFTNMFHDGRLFEDPTHPSGSGFRTPAGLNFPAGIDNALSAQAMFPVQSNAEMAGGSSENLQGAAAAAGNLAGTVETTGEDGVWEIIADKLRANVEYVELFQAAYPDQVDTADDITYVLAANAIGAYEDVAFRAINSPFDRFLRGQRGAMSAKAKQGMLLFYGKAGCSDCHSGPFQTDLDFHAIAMPQIGPGKGDNTALGGAEDFGLEQVSRVDDPDYVPGTDRYKFRTPSLRNVALTAPYGHVGAYNSLRAVVEHHLDPVAGLYAYADDVAAGKAQAVLLPLAEDSHADDRDFTVMSDAAAVADIAAANELEPVSLRKGQIDAIMAFLHALTDESSLDVRALVPWQGVPSGLPLAD